MSQKILIDSIFPQESRVAVVNKENQICHFDYDSATKELLKGNVYLGTVTRVEPSLQAAFIEYMDGKHGFLPFVEIHPDYYQIPAADKVLLKKEAFNEDAPKASNSRSKKFNKSDDSEYNEDKSEARKKFLAKKYQIQEVIKKGQLILVQVIKEERGNKGVSLSTYISLAGRYCVLMPNSTCGRTGGVSRKIADVEERKRLKNLVKSFNMPNSTSLILRTVVAQESDENIKKDYEYLAGLWNNIRKGTLNATAPALVHEEADIIKRVLRDYYSNSISEIVVEGELAYNKIKKLAKAFLPEAVKKIRAYKSKTAVFEYYRIEKDIADFYSPIVPLKSGGSLILDITEAMISIDINSGKATKERSVEETAVKTNLEAAREIARQIYLRDLSGLIVIDFIDMLAVENRKAIEKELRTHTSSDRARIQIGRISNFGLLELSRQRLRPSLIEANTIPCPHCKGNGYLKSFESRAVDIFKAIRRELFHKNVSVVRIYTTADVVADFFNFRKKEIASIESQFKAKVFLRVDANLRDNEYSIESDREMTEEEKNLVNNDKEIDFSSSRSKDKKKADSSFIKMLFGKSE